MRTTLRLFFLLMACLWASMGFAASSDTYENSTITARLISVENGVAETSRTLSLGLDVELAKGWNRSAAQEGRVRDVRGMTLRIRLDHHPLLEAANVQGAL